MEKNFDPIKAAKAQEEYCDAHEIPMYAPHDGICHRCGFNIYLPTNGSRGPLGISVSEADARLITSCPHCHATFVD